jgi:hypothetical protein
MANKKHRLELTWKIEQGSRGTDDDPINSLSRAVNRLFREDGQPFPAISLCFFGDLATRMPRNSPLRWLGAFVWSAGKRALFFPGFTISPVGFQLFQGESRQQLHDDTVFKVDHITLDPDHTWHVTTYKSEAHIPRKKPSFQACPLGDERFLWFGMSIAHVTELRELKKETLVRAYVPASDGKRRKDAFIQARDGVEFCCVSLHPEARMRFQEGFLHFTFIVGPRGFPDYDGDNLAFPFGPPLLPELLPDILTQLPICRYRMSLRPVLDIQIVSMWLPGSLGPPFMLTWPTS